MRNIFLIFLLLPFIFAGSFQSYTEKTTPEASDILLILDNDDLTTKKVQVGNIGDGINWDSVNIQAGGINWTSLDQDIQKGGVNWTSLENSIQKGGVNWASLDDSIQSSGVNWASLNDDINYRGINWATADMSISSTGNVGMGTSSTTQRLYVYRPDMVDFSGPVMTTGYLTNGNNTVSFLDRYRIASTGTPTTNFGFLNQYQLQAADGTFVDAWRSGYQWTDATAKNAEMREIISVGGSPTTKWIRTSDGEMAFNGSSSTSAITAIVDIWGSGSTTGKALQVRNVSSTVNLTIQDNGFVGIGTTSPQAVLNVVKSGTTPPLMISSAAGGLGDYLIVNSSGNIGIGTTNPITTLEVNGLITPDKVTADPCTAAKEGAAFYNDTSNYWCYCDGTNDVKMNDPGTACF